MANQALVQRGDIVFDPFVGTGSLLIAAAKFEGSNLNLNLYSVLLILSEKLLISFRICNGD